MTHEAIELVHHLLNLVALACFAYAAWTFDYAKLPSARNKALVARLDAIDARQTSLEIASDRTQDAVTYETTAIRREVSDLKEHLARELQTVAEERTKLIHMRGRA